MAKWGGECRGDCGLCREEAGKDDAMTKKYCMRHGARTRPMQGRSLNRIVNISSVLILDFACAVSVLWDIWMGAFF